MSVTIYIHILNNLNKFIKIGKNKFSQNQNLVYSNYSKNILKFIYFIKIYL